MDKVKFMLPFFFCFFFEDTAQHWSCSEGIRILTTSAFKTENLSNQVCFYNLFQKPSTDVTKKHRSQKTKN